MKLTIGENIRTLRKEKNLTQEELAEVFGVTYQSVSRWETDQCYPDLELLPDIADFLGVTVDKLIGADKQIEKKEVDRYLERFQASISCGKIDECIAIAREAVTVYPSNYRLLNKLMYALFVAGSDDADIPDWQENMQKYDDEIIALGERITKYCPDVDIRYEAMGRMAFQHCEMGRKELGRRIYEGLPTMDHCRELGIYWALNDEERKANAHVLIEKGFQIIGFGMHTLGHSPYVSDEDHARVFEKAIALRKLLFDPLDASSAWGCANDHFALAKAYTKLNRTDDALHELDLMITHAKAFDARPEEMTTDTLLLGKKTEKRTDFETADSRPLCEIIRDSWLKDPVFDPIRHLPPFADILEKRS